MDGRPPRIASAGAVRRPLIGSIPTVNRPAGPTPTSAASASAVGGRGEAPPLRTNADGSSDGARQQPAHARPQSSPAGRRSLPSGRIAALRAARDGNSGGSSPMHQARPSSSSGASGQPSSTPPARPSSANAAQLRATLEDLQSAVVAMRDVHDVLFQRLGSDASGSFHEHDDLGPNHRDDQELPSGANGATGSDSAIGGDSGQPELRRPGQPIRARPGTAPPRLPGRVAAPGQSTSSADDPDADGASTSAGPSRNGRERVGASPPASTVTTTNDALRATLQLREEILNDIRRIRETASAHDAARRRRRGQPPADLDHQHPDMNENGGGNRGMHFGDQEYGHGGDVHTRYVVGDDGQLYELEGDDDSETEYAEEPQAPPPASEAAIAGLTPVVIPPPATIANADNDTTAPPPCAINTTNVPTANVSETPSPSTLHATAAVSDQKKVSPPRRSPRGGHAKHQERPVSHAPVCAICHDVAGSTSPDILSHVCGAPDAATAATSTAVFNDVEPVDLVPPHGPETPSSSSSENPAIPGTSNTQATTEHWEGVERARAHSHGPQQRSQEQEQEQQRAGHAVMINECGHIFCFACIALWLRRTNSCPTCRATVETPRRQRAPVDLAPSLPATSSQAAPEESALEEHVVQQRTDDGSHVVEAGAGAGPPQTTQPSSDVRTVDHASDLSSSVSPPVVVAVAGTVTIAVNNTETTPAGRCGDEERANAPSFLSDEAIDEGPTNRGEFETTPMVVATSKDLRSEVGAPFAESPSMEVAVGPRGLLQRRRENNNAATSTTASITIDQDDSAIEVDESDPVVGESAPSANNEDVEVTHDAPPARETTSVFSATVDAPANAVPSFSLPQPRGVPVPNECEASLLPTPHAAIPDVSSSDASPASSLRVGASILRPSSCGPSFRGVVESTGHGGSSSALCSPKSSEHSVTFTGPDAKGDAPHRRCRHSAPAVGVHARLAGTGRLRLSSLSSDQHGGTKGRHSQQAGGAGASGSGRGSNSRASNHQRRSDPLTMDDEDEDDYDYDHGESSARVRSVGRGVSQPSPSKYLQDPKMLIERRMRDAIAKEKVVVQQKAEHASAFLQELHQRQQGRGSVHTAATVASPATMGRSSVFQPDGHQHASPGLRRALSAAGPIGATKGGRSNRSVGGPGGRSLSNAGPRGTDAQSENRNGAPVSFLASIATYDIRNPVGSSASDTPAPVYHHATSSSYSRPATANQQVSSGGDPRPRSSPLMPRATSAGAQRPLNNPRSATAPQQSSGSGGTAQETSAHSRHHTIVSKGRGVFAQGQGVQGRAHVGSVRAASAGRLQRGTAARTAAVLQSQLLAAQEAETSSQVVQEIGAILQNVRDITEDSLRRQEHHITSPSSKLPHRRQEHLSSGEDPGARAVKQQRGGGAPPPPPLHEQKAVVSGHVARAARTAVLGPAVLTRSRQYR